MEVLNSAVAARREAGAFLHRHVWWIAAAATFGAAGWAAVVGWWRRRAAAVLAGRAAFELLPASTFEASAAEVTWFAGQLASVPAASGAPPRRASASRVQITCEDNRVRYFLEGPGRAQSLLRMPGYQDVEVIATAARLRQPAVDRIRFEGAQPTGGVR
ncbi:hypothetical protein [Actinacidiphila yanglinensis]|nr:hypothetical protein [Actinacidiphila yanglinensis]